MCRRATRIGASWASACVVALGLMGPTGAQAAFDLGIFQGYGILVGGGNLNVDIDGGPQNTNIGIGAINSDNGKTVDLHNKVINGSVYASQDPYNQTTNPSGVTIKNFNSTGTQPAGLGGPAPSSLNYGESAVDTAIQDATKLASDFATLASKAKLVNLANTTQTLFANQGVLLDATLDSQVVGDFSKYYIPGPSNVYLYQSVNFEIGSGKTLTITGSATDYVVIDITGNSDQSLTGSLLLTGGITANQVLINFLGDSSNKLANGSSGTLNATLMTQNMKVDFDNVTVNGHLFGGATSQDFHLHSGAIVNQYFQGSGGSTPEPGSMALAGLALGASLIFRRNRST